MNIDIFHDTACPWCRIGKRHLEIALENWTGEPVQVRYRSFFLNPSIPVEGYDFEQYMLAKGGGRIPLEEFFAAPRKIGAKVGLEFNFESIRRAPNTSLSHELIALTPEALQKSVVDAIYEAYFKDGLDIGDLDLLVEIASANGMDKGEILPALQERTARDQVTADVKWASQIGVQGVPFFTINQQYALSGAQPPETIAAALDQISN